MRDVHVQMNNGAIECIQYSEYNDRSENELHDIFIGSVSDWHNDMVFNGEERDGLGIV